MQRINPTIYRKYDIQTRLESLNQPCLDIMLTGVTGAGKSTTLNSLLQAPVAKVGEGVNPETMKINSYMLNPYFRLWDTPGLGDGVGKDAVHERKIKELLRRPWLASNGRAFLDMVVVIIEGSKRDLGTTTRLLEKVILPNISGDRVLVAINQSDIAMKGRNWDYSRHTPEYSLVSYLDEFSNSLRQRIYNDTKLRIPKPIYYSATENYNIDVFLDHIINNIPVKMRLL